MLLPSQNKSSFLLSSGSGASYEFTEASVGFDPDKSDINLRTSHSLPSHVQLWETDGDDDGGYAEEEQKVRFRLEVLKSFRLQIIKRFTLEVIKSDNSESRKSHHEQDAASPSPWKHASVASQRRCASTVRRGFPLICDGSGNNLIPVVVDFLPWSALPPPPSMDFSAVLMRQREAANEMDARKENIGFITSHSNMLSSPQHRSICKNSPVIGANERQLQRPHPPLQPRPTDEKNLSHNDSENYLNHF